MGTTQDAYAALERAKREWPRGTPVVALFDDGTRLNTVTTGEPREWTPGEWAVPVRGRIAPIRLARLEQIAQLQQPLFP